MDVGSLRYRIACNRKPQTSPDTDGFLEALTPTHTWASIDPLQSLGDGTHTVQYRVRIRRHPMVSLETVFTWGDVDLYVTGMMDLPHDGLMELLCEVTQP